MSATISNLELEAYFLKEISFSVKNNLSDVPKVVKKVQPVDLEIADLTSVLNNENNTWRCELSIESSSQDNKKSYYDFNIVVVGFFKTNSALTKRDAQTLAECNCPAVLYSTAREIVATLTRRSPYPAVLLPLVTFVKFDKNSKPKSSARKSTKKKETE